MEQEQAKRPAAGTVLATPQGWRSIQGDGFRIHDDGHVEAEIAFAEAVARGLEAEPRRLPYRYLYDRAGSELYEAITAQPEYYLTRAEEEILARHAADIRARAAAAALVEFGSGSSAKTRHLLDAWTAAGPTLYVPIDISIGALEEACRALASDYPGLGIEAVRSSYDRAMPVVASVSPACYLFLGSTVGNFDNAELDEFLEMVSRHLAPGDVFLLGVDLVKDPRTLEAAYDDAAGYTARFTRNLFARMNRELGTAIPLDAVEHVAYYNDRLDRVEIYARFLRELTVELPAIERRFRIACGEMIRTEISRKFRADEMAATAARFGLVRERIYRDDRERFGVLLLRRSRRVPLVENRAIQLAGLLAGVRSRTRQIVEAVPADLVAADPGPPMGPILWDLGHIADFEELWLVRRLEGAAEATEAAALLDPTYDPNVHPRRARSALRLPSLAETLARIDGVRARSLQVLRAGGVDPANPLSAEGFVYRMVAQHEVQHQETVLQAIQMFEHVPFVPSFESSPPRRPDLRVEGGMLLVPAGPCTIGTDDRSLAYDNERPRHRVELASFRIDAAPVTNGRFLEFLGDGGYERPELWSAEGWRWRTAGDVRTPLYWRWEDGEWIRRRFGLWRRLDPARPVMHVSWFEADAFARWAGRRLPTEQEWEKAAAWDPARAQARPRPWGDAPATPALANLGQRLLEPQPIGTYPRGRSFYGCHQMLGDVYEWTSSHFLPYPGFEAFPYPEYSDAFFGDTYRVLRGASWAVPEFMARNSYRNWDLPERRQLFAGFRCAADV